MVQRNGGHNRRDIARPDSGEPVTFVPWPNPPDSLPIRTYSDQMREFWTPSIGSLCVDIAHRVARYLETAPAVTFTWDELAATFGVGRNAASIRKRLDTLHRARFVQYVGVDRYQLRLIAPKLTPRDESFLPEYIAGPYHLLVDPQTDVIDLRDHGQQREPPRQLS